MTFSPRFTLTYRDVLVGVCIMLLAFALRMIVVFDRAANDPAFIPLPTTDQRAYVAQAELWEQGQWPTEPFRWQPGITYFLVGVRALIGHTVGQMGLGTALAGAWACGLMTAVGWLLTRRRWGGYTAGFLLAIYPVAIFFSTVLLTEGLASVLLTLFLFLTLWQREKRTLWRSILLGLTLGILTITRSNMAVLWLAWVFLLALDARRLRPIVFHAAVSLVFMLLMIAPVTLWNRQAAPKGEPFSLITSTGMDEVYRANNRDADGLRSDSPAMQTAIDLGYQEALLTDIKLDPLRFVELQLRKAGLYWNAIEPGNNIDYLFSGEDASPLLKAIPLNFRIIGLLGWLGIVLLLWHPESPQFRATGLFFALVNVLIFAGVMLLWVEGRLKQPAVIPLIATGAYCIVRVGEWLKARDWNAVVRRAALPAVALLLIFGGLDWAMFNLPQMRPVTALPDDVRRMDITFGDNLKLVGWRPLPSWSAAERGWSHFLRSYVVQLYWEVQTPTADDYNAYIALVENGTRLAGVDRAIGTITFRPKPTSQWNAGEIYTEIFGFRIPQDVPLEQVGDIQLGVYLAPKTADNQTVSITPIAATSVAGEPISISLAHLSIFDTGYIGWDLDGYTSRDEIFGGQIALKGYTLPEQATIGETINLGLYWKALAEMNVDYTLFIHLEDESGNLVSQFDTPPRGNTLPTSTWPPDYPIDDAIPIQMPEESGTYSLYIGWYDPLTLTRLASDTPDDRVLIGTITVR